MREIAERVAQRHGLALDELRGPSRLKRTTRPRHEAMAEIYATGDFSWSQLARFFNRDWSTCRSGALKHKERNP
jgi:chromosomal replication initiation ATPase DnaA